MTTDTEIEAAIDAEKAFYDFIATVPESIRSDVETSAWGNSWADGCRDEYESDVHAWQVAKETAMMIADAPADFGLEE